MNIGTLQHLSSTAAAIVAPAGPSPVFDGVMVTVELDGRVQRVQAGVVVPKLRVLNERLAVANNQRRAVRVEMGRLLLAIKKQVPHGMWLETLQVHAGIHPKTAQRCMLEAEQAAGVRPASPKVVKTARRADFTQTGEKHPEVVKNDRVSFFTQSGDRQSHTDFISPPPPRPVTTPTPRPQPSAAEMLPMLRPGRGGSGSAGGAQLMLADVYEEAQAKRVRVEAVLAGIGRGMSKERVGALNGLMDRFLQDVARLACG